MFVCKMSYRLTIPLVFNVLLLFSCNTLDKADIRAVCEKNEEGNYLIKWESFPPIQGTVKIFQSFNADTFMNVMPVIDRPIEEGYTTIIAPDKNKRSYFQLVFNKSDSLFVAERYIKTANVFNLRDIGGYHGDRNRQIRWGKIYRSSTISRADSKDIAILKKLNINTVIDLRTAEDIRLHPSRFKTKQSFKLPVRGADLTFYKEKIKQGEMMKGDVLIMQQDLYVELLKNNTDYFSKVFDILIEDDNYPVLVFCSLGEDRVGLAVALIFYALDVDREQIVQDYMLSNNYIDYNKIVKNASELSYETQETLTALLSANEETINYAFDKIAKDYGSVDEYLEKNLGLTNKKRQKLKDLLLY